MVINTDNANLEKGKVMKYIAKVHTDFKEKFGIPRQGSLISNIKGQIVFEEEYRDINALRGLEEFSHIWILWEFSEAKCEKWSPTVRPPLLGGNKKMGVFATRSPFRPNPIALSVVKLEKIEITKDKGPVIHISGVDLLDGTPIYDIKPYLPYADSIPDAKGGFTEELSERFIKVEMDDELYPCMEKEKKEEIKKILSGDPRPSYQKDENRIYGMKYGSYEIKFMVLDDILTVIDIEKV